MSSPAGLRVDDALDELVNQFADPMSFFRELIQNALDAGSQEVEVTVEFEAGDDPDDGVIVVHVDDFGEGMDRAIIDTKLTRLFSSAKDGDMTKIGKFGIGFVSVFAIAPDAVCVDTSRGGEHWRVLFNKDRSFSRMRLEHPVDGTKIKILKAGSREDFERFEKRAGEVVRYWCKHTAGEVWYQGERINQDFDLPDAPLRVELDDGFSHIVAGHLTTRATYQGFYNQGLTLIEKEWNGRAAASDGVVDLAGLAFKVSSPHLEHTLTRDNVIRDTNFEKAKKALLRLVDGGLARRVFDEVQTFVDPAEGDAGPPGDAERESYAYWSALWHFRRGAGRSRDLRGHRVLTCAHAEPAELGSLHSTWERGGDPVFWTATETPLSEAVASKQRVLLLPRLGPTSFAEGVFDERLTPVQARFCRPVPPRDRGERASWHPLSREVEGLMRDHGAKISGVELAHFDYPHSPIANRVAITQREPFALTELEDARTVGRGFFSWSRALVVNADHPTVDVLVRLAEREPELAAYQLVKLFFLGAELDLELDGALATRAMERRWARLPG